MALKIYVLDMFYLTAVLLFGVVVLWLVMAFFVTSMAFATVVDGITGMSAFVFCNEMVWYITVILNLFSLAL